MSKMTPAVKRALQVLVSGDALRSNATHLPGMVYWQTANWLAREGLVDIDPMTGRITLTDLGRARAHEEGLA